MTKRNQRQVVNDRRAKKAEKGKNFSEKFEDERQGKAKPIVAQTENQKIYLKYLQTKQMVAGVGRAGSGKSYVAVSHAANKLINGEIWLTDEEIGERLDVMFEMRALRQQESLGENQQLEEHKTLDQMIEEAVSSFYKKLKKDFEITPKVKATKAKQAAPATA